MRLLITTDGSRFFFKEKDIHTEHGYDKADAIEKAKPGDILLTNLNKEMHVVDAGFIDLYDKIKRSAQIIPRKDVGIIISEVGLEVDWKIVDSGSGSGGLCCFLAHLVSKGKVYTYDIREDHLAIVQKNIELLGLKNIIAAKGDVYSEIPHKNIDLITLDLPEPWNALDNAVAALKPGGYLVSYSPCIPQVSDFVEAVAKKKELIYLKTLEVASREWEFIGRKIRPKTRQEIGHSGFISFVRRV